MTSLMDKRIHIVPVGYDYYTRVVEPLLDPRADKVFFVRHEKGAIRGHDKFFKKIVQKVKNLRIPFEETQTDIWDLYKCIEIFRKKISEETKKRNMVYINVSTGTKVTAMAGILSCMMWGQKPYYVRLKNPTKKKITSIPKVAVEQPQRLPIFEIKKPNSIIMKVLERLQKQHDGMLRKRQLVEFLENEKIIKPQDPSEEFSINAKLGQLQSIIYPMEKEWKYIIIEQRGSRSQVRITEEGKQALQIFGI